MKEQLKKIIDLLQEIIDDKTIVQFKDWQIESFYLKNMNSYHDLKANGLYSSQRSSQGHTNIDLYLSQVVHGCACIHSIRIISTDTVYTIGNRMISDNGITEGINGEKITKFEIYNDQITAHYDYGCFDLVYFAKHRNLRFYIDEIKPEFKIGDLVIWNGSKPVMGKIFGRSNFKNCWVLEVCGDIDTWNTCHEDFLRHATPRK